MIEVSEVLFILFLQWIRCLSGVTLDKLSPRPDTPERRELSLLTSISLGFLFLVIFSDKLADEIYLDLLTDSTVSYSLVFLVYLDLSNDLPLSYLLLMDSSFFLCMLVIYLFSWLCQYIFCNGRSDGFLHHIMCFSHVINTFFDNFFCSIDQWLFGRNDPGDWSSLPSLLQNQSNCTGNFN